MDDATDRWMDGCVATAFTDEDGIRTMTTNKRKSTSWTGPAQSNVPSLGAKPLANFILRSRAKGKKFQVHFFSNGLNNGVNVLGKGNFKFYSSFVA